MSSRDEIAAILRRWESGAVTAAQLKEWLDAARALDGDRAAASVLAELDLLEIHLLTGADVPALFDLLNSDGSATAVGKWATYRDAIDLDARSRQLKKDKFYKPFCR